MATSVSATNFAGDQSGFRCDTSQVNETCLSDNSTFYVYKNVGANYAAAIDATLYGSWDTTDIAVYSASQAHGSSTDAYYYYVNLPNSLLGQVNCQSVSSSDARRCTHFHVELDQLEAIAQGWGDGTSADQQRLQAIACHETGHTLGLFHVTNGSASTYHCMRNTTTSNFGTVPHTVGPHNVGHVDGFY